MKEASFSIEQALRFGWDAARKNLKTLIWLVGAGFLLWLFDNAIASGSAQRTTAWGAASSALASLLVQVASVYLAMVWIRVALRIRDGQPIDLRQALLEYRGFLAFLLTYVLYALIVAAGLLLLIVPGIIWAAQFGFATYAVVDRAVDPIAALKRSSALTRGAKGRVILFGLILFGINLVGALALGIGLIVTIPLSVLAAAHVYRQLEARETPALAAREKPPDTGHPAEPTPVPS